MSIIPGKQNSAKSGTFPAAMDLDGWTCIETNAAGAYNYAIFPASILIWQRAELCMRRDAPKMCTTHAG